MAAKILGMQQTLGNQAVQSRASSCPAFPSACPTGGVCHTCPARVQAKLAVNQPGDVYEKEADRVADRVMDNAGSLIAERRTGTPVLSRQAAPAANEEQEKIALAPSEGGKVLAQGEKWIGTPYKWGGDSKVGIDCSHFVHRAYSEAGLDYDYLSTGSFSDSPNFSKIAPPLVGDVVLFGKHMGIHNPDPPQSGKTILSAGSSGVSYGKPEWYGTVNGYYRYKRRDQLQGQLQKKSIDENGASSRPVPSIVDEILHSPGQPLDASARAFFELRFGHDFSQVRVHTDTKAMESARAVNALAYTVGRDIVFGARQYAPETAKGRQLIAHELTHVLQQRGMNLLQRQTDDENAGHRSANGDTAGGCGITVPTDLDTQRLAGSIFSEASPKAVSNDEREAIGQVFLNRVFHVDVLCSDLLGCGHTEKASHKQCERDAKDFGTTVLEAIQKGSTAYENKRWNMVMSGDAMKPVPDLCKLVASEITALSAAITGAETAVKAGGHEGCMAFNRDGPPSERMQEAKVIGPHHFHEFKPGRECG